MKKAMSQPLRVENPEHWSFSTSRTIRSELWFVNNHELNEHVVTFLARYAERHRMELYAFCMMGNHYHAAAKFPEMNRASFYRDLNARIAEGVRYHVTDFERGPVFERRYSEQAIARPEDLEEYFFYCALQPIKAGLCSRLSDYSGYNSFDDAISGRKLKRKYVDWEKYNAAKLSNPEAKIAEYTEIHILEFKRLPGYESLSQREYKNLMLRKYSERRQLIIDERTAKGQGFVGKEGLCQVKPGSRPAHTKQSTRRSKRPLILTRCNQTKKAFLAWYFQILNSFRIASKLFRGGNLVAEFPPGTYRPPLCLVPG